MLGYGMLNIHIYKVIEEGLKHEILFAGKVRENVYFTA
jgi:hypothetical protein